METIILSKKKFDSLESLELDKSIVNSEGQLFKFSEKRKWQMKIQIFSAIVLCY